MRRRFLVKADSSPKPELGRSLSMGLVALRAFLRRIFQVVPSTKGKSSQETRREPMALDETGIREQRASSGWILCLW